MSDLGPMVAVILLTLLFASLMLVTRLRAGGVPGHRLSMLIGELWLIIGAAVALFVTMGNVLGPAGDVSGGLGAELQDLGRRFAALNAESKMLFVIGAALALGLFAHLLYSLSRAMRAAPPP